MSHVKGRYLATVTVDFEKDISREDYATFKDKISGVIMSAIASHLHDADVNITGIVIHNEYCNVREEKTFETV